MFDVATRRQLQRWCVKQKKVFMGKATSNIHKIDENFGMLQKKGTWWAYFSADARTIWSRQRCTMHIHPKWRQTFLKNSSLFFLCDEVRVKWFKYCNHQQKKNSSTASKENSCNVIKAVFQRAQFPPPLKFM